MNNDELDLAGKTILIVDDEDELREALVYDFKRRKCLVLEARDGLEAYEIFLKHKIDIIISDVRMPQGNGVDLLKKIRALHPEIPVVLLATGFADITSDEGVKLGALAVLDKPIDRKKMFKLLANATVFKKYGSA